MTSIARRHWFILLVVLHITRIACAAAPASQPAASASDVLAFLNQTIDWYHRVETIDPSPGTSQELLLRSNVRDNARQATRLATQFARAEAAMLDAGAATRPVSGAGKAGSARGRNVGQLAAATAERVQKLQAQLDQMDREMQESTPT